MKGIEPSTENPQVAENKHLPKDGDGAYTQISAQIEGKDGRDLSHVVRDGERSNPLTR